MLQEIRYPVFFVVPLTRKSLDPGPLYIRLQAGMGGLPMASTVLLDQLLTIDARRVKGSLGRLTQDQYSPISKGLLAVLAGQDKEDF